jgi:hypothetical protein
MKHFVWSRHYPQCRGSLEPFAPEAGGGPINIRQGAAIFMPPDAVLSVVPRELPDQVCSGGPI